MPHKLIDLAIVVVLLVGISWFRSPQRARRGNMAAALAVLAAVVVILVRHTVSPVGLLWVFAALGALAGLGLARSVRMVRIPAMVALQNGMGGMASFLVSYVELTRSAGAALPRAGEVAAVAGILVGAGTFSGSLVAAGKLANRLRQTPVRLAGHNLILSGLAIGAVLAMALGVVTRDVAVTNVLAAALIALSVGLGIVFSIRIGGADMPVLISFLNAGSGLAAALCGLAIGNWLLIACGAMVGVSGTILTHVMCRAMNRNLRAIFTGIQPSTAPAVPGFAQNQDEPTVNEGQPVPLDTSFNSSASTAEGTAPAAVAGAVLEVEADHAADPFARAMNAVQAAQRVIIIPGYGMALADAQEEVVQLADQLVAMGKNVIFAIHPVAGRMPGHMHVLLAEAEVDYTQIRELKDVNTEFPTADLALIVGACDVVNPAAIDVAGTPISGMPILRAHEAREVIVCNLDDRPGYSGVENPLYREQRTIMLLGDAKETVSRILESLSSPKEDKV